MKKKRMLGDWDERIPISLNFSDDCPAEVSQWYIYRSALDWIRENRGQMSITGCVMVLLMRALGHDVLLRSEIKKKVYECLDREISEWESNEKIVDGVIMGFQGNVTVEKPTLQDVFNDLVRKGIDIEEGL